MIVTRFAPSPTGFLHLGHAFAAITAYEAARKRGGRFLVRIEDIDTTRCRPEFEHAIFADLEWLGLSWEQPVRRQSEHFPEYAQSLQKLEAAGFLYPCYCTRKEIAEEIARAGIAPQASELGSDSTSYPGTCRNVSEEVRSLRRAQSHAFAWRLDVAKARMFAGKELLFEEAGCGPRGEAGQQIAQPEALGDLVIARKDVPVSYHLAVVEDDFRQGVSLVTRGNDLFSATHVQRLLQSLLGYPTPVYAHHRLILDGLGRKFSKRDRAVTLAALRQSGATPNDVRAMVGL